MQPNEQQFHDPVRVMLADDPWRPQDWVPADRLTQRWIPEGWTPAGIPAFSNAPIDFVRDPAPCCERCRPKLDPQTPASRSRS